MTLVSLISFALILFLVFWLVSILPLPQPLMTILQIIMAIVFLYWLLENTGFIPHNLRLR